MYFIWPISLCNHQSSCHSPKYNFISSLGLAIRLRVLHRRKNLSSSHLITQLLHLQTYKLGSIVRDNTSRNFESTYYILPNKLFNFVPTNHSHMLCFDPFCKVFHRYYKKLELSNCLWKWAQYIYPPCVKRPRCID